MKERGSEKGSEIPSITKAQIEELRGRLASLGNEPLHPIGTQSTCPNCGGRMVTTNDLEKAIPTPGLLFVVTRLPGSRCLSCSSTLIDGSAAASVEAHAGRGLIADYETAVTRASGKTLGTYFKMDLVRVLGLKGDEQLFWKIVDRNLALVEIVRHPKPPATSRTSVHRHQVARRSHPGPRAEPNRAPVQA